MGATSVSGRSSRSGWCLGVTFARRDEVVPGLGDVGESEVDHGPRVSAARQRCLPHVGHRAVFLTAVASRRFPSFLLSSRTDGKAHAATASSASTCARSAARRTVTSSVQNKTDGDGAVPIAAYRQLRDRKSVAPRTRGLVAASSSSLFLSSRSRYISHFLPFRNGAIVICASARRANLPQLRGNLLSPAPRDSRSWHRSAS